MPPLQLGNITVDVIRKDIKNIHLSVHPPAGKVRISAPQRFDLDTIRVFALSKLPWIKKQQARLRSQEREASREYINRESHFYQGYMYFPTPPNHAGTCPSSHKDKLPLAGFVAQGGGTGKGGRIDIE